MSRFCRPRTAALCMGLLLGWVGARAQAPQGSSAADSSALQAMALGPQQAQLTALLGRWDVEIVLSNGATPAQHSTGTADYAWVIKGRWLGCHVERRSKSIITQLFGELDEYTSGVLHRPYKVLLNRLSPDRHGITIVAFDDSGREVPKIELVLAARAPVDGRALRR